MAQQRLGIIMNGVSGRMGTNQHLIRSILATRAQGGVALKNGDTVMPDPILVGRNEAKLAQLAKAHGIARWTTDLNVALRSREDTLFFDAATTKLRAKLLRRAIAAGKDIYCEKPVAETLADALDIARAAKEAGVKHGVVQDKIFLPGLLKLKMLIDFGFFGRIFAVRGEFGYWVFEGDWQPAQRPSWNYRKKDGGGIILDMLCHWSWSSAPATTASARWRFSPPTIGGSATPTRCCASASSGTRRWYDVLSRRGWRGRPVKGRVPGAAQHAVVRCRPGTVPVCGGPGSAGTAPQELRFEPIRHRRKCFALHRIRDTRDGKRSQQMSTTYDAIILGAGHNGLILQAYLGKAGMKTLAVERRAVAGGGLSTIEDPRQSGFFHNTHAFFLRAITAMPWYADLDLARHGAQLIEPELNVALITSDGRALEWWTDIGKTIDSFATFSARDAQTLRRWHDEFVPIVETILAPEARSPPLPSEQRRALLSRTVAGRQLLAVSALSPLEFVSQEFEHPTIKAGLLFFNGLREVDLRLKGFGHHIAALLASPAKAQMARGGSAAVARALAEAVRETGGEIRLSTEPAHILVEGGRAVGVETRDGELIRAKHLVASSLNPHQTFLDLLDESLLPREIRERAQNFRYNLLAPLFGLYLDLAEPPFYSASAKHPALARAFMVILGLDHVERFSDIVRHHEAGIIPPTVMWGACPTLFDAGQAPAGRHTAFMWEKLPYRVDGDPSNWDRLRDDHARDMRKLWQKHAPNLADAIVDSFARTPLDTARELPNMREGDLLVGAFANDQVGYHRPFAGAGAYRTHLPGLYLCGASSHPGGNVTGLPAYNAAQVILADLGLAAEWLPSPIAAQRGLGLLPLP